jgi:hypothetical protein
MGLEGIEMHMTGVTQLAPARRTRLIISGSKATSRPDALYGSRGSLSLTERLYVFSVNRAMLLVKTPTCRQVSFVRLVEPAPDLDKADDEQA